MSKRSTLAITAGEPAGIGPDLLLARHTTGDVREVIVADADMLRDRARVLGIDRPIVDYQPQEDCDSQVLQVLHTPLAAPVTAGELNPANSPYVLDTIARAVDGCRDGEFDAMVTAPVHKGVINDAGVAFSGHTEFIAEMVQATPLMMLAAQSLRVALVTTHLPLADVSATINSDAIVDCLQILDRDLRTQFGIAQPRILVCGLNPHAGESGHLGREEIEQIEPAIAQANRHNIDAIGPLPADTLFTPRHLEHADAVLAMYHDQGLPVLKYAGFGEAVNITLGLPIIRTSVDHGTALDLAGTGNASGGSLNAAIAMAAELAGQRNGRS